ncbi:hypothetical protein C0Q70_14493 [Pomacea canaliculata]|uniref:C-type lectin domain-containing protein n=1 Tax=Pomacea canaliculata TaxID=400727 RepID=A0A2T7NS65_POMCA|nr:hypothetical protein C0Q70_14493 [Pomacea canaliculata]
MTETDECEREKLSLYSEEPLDTHLILRTCDSRQPPVSLYNVSKLHIHFRSVRLSPETGFRLFFSFHTLSALPQQLSDGRWNCSVPHWPDFRLHFPCNLVSDCVGNEDEEDCPYTGHVCGPGFLSANVTCLQFVKPFQDVSWETAAETCKSRGLVLMTANTPAEWEATRDLLRRYRQLWIGVDGIANYLQQLDTRLQHDDCLGISIYSDYHYGPSVAECNYNYWSWFACKFPVSPDDTLPQMPVLLTANWSVDVLQCPSLHYTHTFLACDVKSECWADKYDNSKTCSTPVTSRPPLFSCINEIQRVPYSLVCDHRSHCSDDSDEKFCIFPSCPRKKDFFECDNKQLNDKQRRVAKKFKLAYTSQFNNNRKPNRGLCNFTNDDVPVLCSKLFFITGADDVSGDTGDSKEILAALGIDSVTDSASHAGVGSRTGGAYSNIGGR